MVGITTMMPVVGIYTSDEAGRVSPARRWQKEELSTKARGEAAQYGTHPLGSSDAVMHN